MHIVVMLCCPCSVLGGRVKTMTTQISGDACSSDALTFTASFLLFVLFCCSAVYEV